MITARETQNMNIKPTNTHGVAGPRKTPCHLVMYVLEKIGALFNGSYSALEAPTSFYSTSGTSSKYRSLPTQVERFSQGALLARRVARSGPSHLFSFGSLSPSSNFSSNLIGCKSINVPPGQLPTGGIPTGEIPLESDLDPRNDVHPEGWRLGCVDDTIPPSGFPRDFAASIQERKDDINDEIIKSKEIPPWMKVKTDPSP